MASAELGAVPDGLDHQIVRGEREQAALGPDLALYITTQPGESGRVFKRRGIKIPMGAGATRAVYWLVGELEGVRVYVERLDGRHVIHMTTEDRDP